MTPSLFDALIDDHENIRGQIARLNSEVAMAKPNEERCLESFRTLKASIVAHAKAEEFALYGLVEEPHSSLEKELQHFAFEGYEEHDLMDFLMKEMGMAEELSLQWRAQLVVLGEMLDRHLSEEEEVFFSKIRKLLSDESIRDLGKAYAQERAAIFAKKIGLRPALSLAPSIQH